MELRNRLSYETSLTDHQMNSPPTNSIYTERFLSSHLHPNLSSRTNLSHICNSNSNMLSQDSKDSYDWKQKIAKLKRVLGEEVGSARHAFQSPTHAHQDNIDHVSGMQHPSMQHQTPSTFNTSQQSSASVFSSVLQQRNSFQAKCEEVSRLCSSCSSKELIEVYPQLLSEVYGFSGSQGWRLNMLEPCLYSYDFNVVYNFLAPNGFIFNIIDKLMMEHDAIFQFPYSALPADVKESIGKGQVPIWYQNKLVVLPGNQVIVNFNALEYFIVLFAYFVSHPKTLQQPSNWSSVEDVLYIRLLEEYLKYFLPFDSLSYDSSRSPSTSTSFNSPMLQKSEIRRSPDVMNQQSYQNILSPAASASRFQKDTSKAELFLQILCGFWLGLNTEEYIQKEQEYRLPSIDHARVVRILVKYLHAYVNSNREHHIQTYSGDNYGIMQEEEFKSVVIPALLHQKLYGYLKHCFTHWPLDSSFRMVLETWLSFIQPWRYQDHNLSISDDSIEVDLSSWKQFTCENLLFYSSIFQIFLLRGMRYDMMSARDIQLIYRVAKVFSQPSLSELLREELDDNSSASLHYHTSAGNAMFLGLMSNTKRLQLENPVHNYQPLFSVETTQNVQKLCQKLASAVIGLRHKILQATNDTNTNTTGIVACVKEFFMMEENEKFDRQHEQRLVEYLEQSCFLLTSMFKLPTFQTMPNNTPTSSNGLDPTDDIFTGIHGPAVPVAGDDTMPDYVVTGNEIMLTDRGRYQIIQGLRQFHIVYSGDLELQPVCSYECAAAVRFLYKMASRLNNKYSNTLEWLYNRQDFIGTLLKKSSKGLGRTHYIDTPISLPRQPSSSEILKPRLSLRFAGSYYFMGYVCWVMILARLFGFSWFGIIFLVIVIWFICMIYHVDSPPKGLKND